MTAELPNAAALGFLGSEETGWTREVRGQEVRLRLLRSLDDLAHAERLQEDVFGVTERDLIPANELIVVPETGGTVIAAFLPGAPDHAAGVLVGWGGFVERPRLVSDFLAVRPEARNIGLAAELKRLQAVLALARGFQEIVWTVDPLRAANARLNFGKLGAVARSYELDRYGSTFAAELYGGLPTDRLHVTWEITTPRVLARLTNERAPLPASPDPSPPAWSPGLTAPVATLDIPADIDGLLVADAPRALAWRFQVREALVRAFAEGFAVTGFVPAVQGKDPALLLQRDAPART